MDCLPEHGLEVCEHEEEELRAILTNIPRALLLGPIARGSSCTRVEVVP